MFCGPRRQSRWYAAKADDRAPRERQFLLGPRGRTRVRSLEMRDVRRLTIKGRLASDTTLAQAQTELSVIAKDLARAYQDTNRNTLLTVRTEFQDRLAGSPPNAMLIVMLSLLAAAVLFV